MIEWQDKGGGSTAKVGFTRVTVTFQNGPKRWLMTTTGAYWRHELKAQTLDQAKRESLAKLHEELMLAAALCKPATV